MEAGQDKALEQAFFRDGYRIAGEHVDSDCSPASVSKGLDVLYASLDTFISMFLTNAAGSAMPAHCKKGCSWCCHQAVFAETHTMTYLVHKIREQLSPEQLELSRQAAENKHTHTTSLGKSERLSYKYPCPLLKEGACMVYNGRPVSCRIYLSSDVSSCRYEFEHPNDTSVFPQLYALPLQLGRKLNEGFAAKLVEMGMEIFEFPLEEGLVNQLT